MTRSTVLTYLIFLQKIFSNKYYILDSAIGIENNSKQLIIYILSQKFSNNIECIEKDRTLVVFQKDNDRLTLIDTNSNLIYCKNCGGIMGDPYAGINLTGNDLEVNIYGGSAWRWAEKHTFRYQNDNMELIQADYLSFWTNAPCTENDDLENGARNAEDINFSTSKMHIVHSIDNSCKPYEDYWKNFEKKKPITLGNFPGKSSQWPNNKIKDGDGK